MKKFILTMLLSLGLAIPAQAGLIGTGDVNSGFTVGYNYEDIETDLDHSVNDEANVDRQYVNVSYGVNDYLGIFVKLGEQELDVSNLGMNLDNAFVWGIGVQGEYKEVPFLQNYGVEAFASYQYLRAEHDIDSRVSTAVGSLDVLVTEHQYALGVKKDFSVQEDISVTPYGGVNWKLLDVGSIEQEDSFGSFAGAKVTYKNDYSVNFETHFANEEGFGANTFVSINF